MSVVVGPNAHGALQSVGSYATNIAFLRHSYDANANLTAITDYVTAAADRAMSYDEPTLADAIVDRLAHNSHRQFLSIFRQLIENEEFLSILDSC